MKRSYLSIAAFVAVSFLLSGCSSKVSSKTGDQLPQQTQASQPIVQVRTDVPNKAFYKDVFNHAGLGLDTNIDLPYLHHMGLTSEYVGVSKHSRENRDIQNSLFCGNPDDANGVLLYPDGEPRFRMLYVNGGSGDACGRGVEEQGRNNIRTFIDNGGCYVGNCAGAYFVGTGASTIYYGGYVGIWPGNVDLAHTPVWAVGYIIPKDSPLLKYADFGGDFYVDSVRHHNGPYFEHYDQVPGTEVLAINDYPAYKFHQKPAAIAYKADCYKGRLVPIGGHPEGIEEGERLDLMCAFVQYSLDGQGCAKAKAILSNGELCKMTKSTEDNDPAHTKIGDKQCHHFVFSLPKRARNVHIRLESLEDYELSLRLAKGTFAFKEDAQYAKEGKELVKEMTFSELEAGTWYIGVQCENTVEAKEIYKNHYEYSNTAILNGAPYTISVKWDELETGVATLMRGIDFNERIKQSVNRNLVSYDKDSTITKIIIKTGVKNPEGFRLDDESISEEPVCAVVKNGVVTISTPAHTIKSGRLPGFLFCGFTALKSVENFKAIDFSEAVTVYDLFMNCTSLESLDMSAFKGCSPINSSYLFDGCYSLKKVDVTGFSTENIKAATSWFRLMPSLEEARFCKLTPEAKRELYTTFTGTTDSTDRRTCTRTGKLKVYCDASDAQWIASRLLDNLRSGKDKGNPVDVHVFDIATNKEINVEWK